MIFQKNMAFFPKQCLHYGVLAFSRAGEHNSPARGSRTRKIIKKPSVFKLFQTKWCWRSSFEFHLFVFWWMLQLILLFFIKRCLWVTRSPQGYQGGIWAPWLVVCKPPTSWLVACKPPTSWLVVCKTNNQLVVGLQTTNQLVGCLQTTNQLVGGFV